TAGGHVDHHDKEAEEEDGRSEVALEDQDADAHQPGGDHRTQVLEAGELHGTDLPAGQEDEVPVGRQITREEYGQGDLGDFTRLESHGADADPDAGTEHLTGGDAGP